MALPTSGALSLNAIHIEAGGTTDTTVSFNDSDIIPYNIGYVNPAPWSALRLAPDPGSAVLDPLGPASRAALRLASDPGSQIGSSWPRQRAQKNGASRSPPRSASP